MKRINIRRIARVLAIGATTIVSLGTVAVFASIPSPTGVINGCVAKGGALSVIDSTATCPKGTTALNFNQTGPAGQAGPAGATGATGASGFETISFVTSTIAPVDGGNGAFIQQAICPSNSRLIAGGYHVNTPISAAVSEPGQQRLSWVVIWPSDPGSDATVTATCVTP